MNVSFSNIPRSPAPPLVYNYLGGIGEAVPATISNRLSIYANPWSWAAMGGTYFALRGLRQQPIVALIGAVIVPQLIAGALKNDSTN